MFLQMVDTVDRATRSRVMSAVKQRDSRIEKMFRLALWHAGLRYRKNVRILGTPDVLFRAAKVVVFIDSCFWHGCSRHGRMPKSNVAFWRAKIDRNRRRDLRITRTYRRQGWRVVRVWEHELTVSSQRAVGRVMSAVARAWTVDVRLRHSRGRKVPLNSPEK